MLYNIFKILIGPVEMQKFAWLFNSDFAGTAVKHKDEILQAHMMGDQAGQVNQVGQDKVLGLTNKFFR